MKWNGIEKNTSKYSTPGKGKPFMRKRCILCVFVCICTLSHHIKCIYCCGLRFKNMERKESLMTAAPSEFHLRQIDRKKRPISLFRSQESKKERKRQSRRFPLSRLLLNRGCHQRDAGEHTRLCRLVLKFFSQQHSLPTSFWGVRKQSQLGTRTPSSPGSMVLSSSLRKDMIAYILINIIPFNFHIFLSVIQFTDMGSHVLLRLWLFDLSKLGKCDPQ